MTTTPELSLPEWTVLTVLSQHPAHGFAVAQLTAPHAELGRIWSIPRPIIYRALGRLADAGLITPQGTEPGQGPQRTIYAATPHGHTAATTWLHTPVHHIRDIRSHLLLKLALLHRTHTSPAALLTAQRAILEPIATATATTPPTPRHLRRHPARLAPHQRHRRPGLPRHHHHPRTPARGSHAANPRPAPLGLASGEKRQNACGRRAS